MLREAGRHFWCEPPIRTRLGEAPAAMNDVPLGRHALLSACTRDAVVGGHGFGGVVPAVRRNQAVVLT